MLSYSIKDLERITNIKAHTIRIWEQRYTIFSPFRSETNIRSYSSSDLKKLIKIKALLEQGSKISKLSTLSEEELNQKFIGLYLKEKVTPFSIYIDTLLDATLNLDENLFNKQFSSCILTHGLFETMIQVIYPFLHKIGLFWNTDKVVPLQEHFISNLIKQKLYAAIEGSYFPFNDNPKTIVLFLNEEEEHEIALLFANYLIRKFGHKVIYLGPKVPLENILDLYNEIKIDAFYTYFTLHIQNQEFADISSKIIAKFENCLFYYSGVQYSDSQIHDPLSVIYIEDLNSLIKTFKTN